MLVLAARQMRFSTAFATGQWPKTSPPVSAGGFPLGWLNGQDLVYACAHGMPGGDTLYGDNSTPFLTAQQIRASEMPGAIVYLAGCFGLGAISDAFLAADAAAVVADEDVNWAGPLWPSGSNKLGHWFLRFLRQGLPVGESVIAAKKAYTVRNARDLELVTSVGMVGSGKARLIRRES